MRCAAPVRLGNPPSHRQERRCLTAVAAVDSDAEATALSDVRALLLDPARLVRAVASVSGSRAAPAPPAASRAELRPVLLKGELRLSVQQFVGTQAFTTNHAFSDQSAATAVSALLLQRFDNWRVETSQETLTLTRNRRGQLASRRAPPPLISSEALSHDRSKARMLEPGSPVLQALGICSADGKVKAAKADKFAQVDAFLRTLDVAVTEALAARRLPPPSAARPLRLVDLGCGNAYLTFASYALMLQRGLPCTVVGVDVKAQALERNSALAAQLGWTESCSFVQGSIRDASAALQGREAPHVVLALHACDTATDDALAAAVRWRAPLVLAAPCCQHAVQTQLKAGNGGGGGHPHPMLSRHGVLRERLGDVLTDALRAHVLGLLGYRVGVSEFVGSEHTPRNVLLRADLTEKSAQAEDWRQLDMLCADWGIQPPLADALHTELAAARARAQCFT